MDGCIYVDDRVEKSYNLNSAIILPGPPVGSLGKSNPNQKKRTNPAQLGTHLEYINLYTRVKGPRPFLLLMTLYIPNMEKWDF